MSLQSKEAKRMRKFRPQSSKKNNMSPTQGSATDRGPVTGRPGTEILYPACQPGNRPENRKPSFFIFGLKVKRTLHKTFLRLAENFDFRGGGFGSINAGPNSPGVQAASAKRMNVIMMMIAYLQA